MSCNNSNCKKLEKIFNLSFINQIIEGKKTKCPYCEVIRNERYRNRFMDMFLRLMENFESPQKKVILVEPTSSIPLQTKITIPIEKFLEERTEELESIENIARFVSTEYQCSSINPLIFVLLVVHGKIFDYYINTKINLDEETDIHYISLYYNRKDLCSDINVRSELIREIYNLRKTIKNIEAGLLMGNTVRCRSELYNSIQKCGNYGKDINTLLFFLYAILEIPFDQEIEFFKYNLRKDGLSTILKDWSQLIFKKDNQIITNTESYLKKYSQDNLKTLYNILLTYEKNKILSPRNYQLWIDWPLENVNNYHSISNISNLHSILFPAGRRTEQDDIRKMINEQLRKKQWIPLLPIPLHYEPIPRKPGIGYWYLPFEKPEEYLMIFPELIQAGYSVDDILSERVSLIYKHKFFYRSQEYEIFLPQFIEGKFQRYKESIQHDQNKIEYFKLPGLNEFSPYFSYRESTTAQELELLKKNKNPYISNFLENNIVFHIKRTNYLVFIVDRSHDKENLPSSLSVKEKIYTSENEDPLYLSSIVMKYKDDFIIIFKFKNQYYEVNINKNPQEFILLGKFNEIDKDKLFEFSIYGIQYWYCLEKFLI